MVKGIEPRKKADGTISYRVRFRIEKGTNPTTETFDTLKGAQEFKHLVDTLGGKAARELRDASDTQLVIKTLDDVLEAYITRVNSYAAKGTGDDYKRVAKRTWLRYFPDNFPIASLTRTAVEAWITWQRAQPTRNGFYSSKSIRNAQGVLSSMCEYAIEQGIITTNPAKGVKIPQDQAKKQKMYLTGEQMAKILQHLPEQYHPFVLLIYGTGIRRGEAIALTPADFDFESTPATVRIEKAFKQGVQKRLYLGSPKSKAGYRTITLPENTRKILEPYVRSFDATDVLIFPSPRDSSRPMDLDSFLEWHWHPAVEAAKIDGRPGLHDLRHSHASALIKHGIPLPVIQRRLGHESIKTTVDTYGHLSRESWVGAAEAMAVEMSPALPEVEESKQLPASENIPDADIVDGEIVE